MKRHFETAFLVFLLAWTSLGSAAEWRVGVARTEITPTKMLWMSGYAARKHPAEGVAQPLWAKAIVIADGEDRRVAIVTIDLIGDCFGQLTEKIAAEVHQVTGLERGRILFNFSHTHSGPVETVNDGALITYGLDAEQQAAINEYSETELEPKLVKLIVEASETLRPATLAHGEDEATFAANRRKRFNPDGPVDHTVPVLRVNGEDGRPIAILFGYACHTATLGGDFYEFNGDYAGFAQDAIERENPGATAMYVAGCGADINPDPRGTLDLAQEHGESLAAAVDRAMDAEMRPLDGPLRVAFDRVDIPFVDPPTRDELEVRIGEGSVYDQRLTELLIKRIDEKGKIETEYPCPIQVVRFGDDLALVAISGETVVDYALRIRREFPDTPLWVAGYSNEVFAYLPSERILAEGGYEAADAMRYFGFHGPFKPGVEGRVMGLVEELLKRTR